MPTLNNIKIINYRQTLLVYAVRITRNHLFRKPK
ncbi:hypothetical protein KVMX100_20077 [Klebsiella variicola]|nr:hypothetical protein KVMX100_20077 [Klebsiella variicola]